MLESNYYHRSVDFKNDSGTTKVDLSVQEGICRGCGWGEGRGQTIFDINETLTNLYSYLWNEVAISYWSVLIILLIVKSHINAAISAKRVWFSSFSYLFLDTSFLESVKIPNPIQIIPKVNDLHFGILNVFPCVTSYKSTSSAYKQSDTTNKWWIH